MAFLRVAVVRCLLFAVAWSFSTRAGATIDASLTFSPPCFTPGTAGNRVKMEAINNSAFPAQPLIIFQVRSPVDGDGESLDWDVAASKAIPQPGNQPPLSEFSVLDGGKTIRATTAGGASAWAPGKKLTVEFVFGVPPLFSANPAAFKYIVYTFGGGSPAEESANLPRCGGTSAGPRLKATKYPVTVSGQLVSYVVDVENEGDAPTTAEITVKDTLPGGLTATRVNVVARKAVLAGISTSAKTVIYATPPGFVLAAKEKMTLWIYANVAPGTTGTIVNKATVCGGGDASAPCASPRSSNQVNSTLPPPTGPPPAVNPSFPANPIAGLPAVFKALFGSGQAGHAAAAAATSYAWILPDVPIMPAALGPELTHTFAKPGKHKVTLLAFANGVRSATDLQVNVGSAAASCSPNATTLCLLGGRFRVQADWQALNNQSTGAANTRSITSDTGAFWFFDAANLELIVKLIDGRGLNGKFWVFFGALSDVQYQIKVTDTQTGQVREYVNRQGDLASHADTAAFPIAAASTADAMEPAADDLAFSGDELADASHAGPINVTSPACLADPGTKKLCLSDRFDVAVACTAQGVPCTPNPVKLTSDTGYFWFFNSANIELMTKVVDGRGLNGKFWFFYGALSNVQYKIRLTDRQTGKFKEYTNPQGTLASVADTSALTP